MIDSIHKILSFGVIPTIIVFISVQVIIHFNKINRLEKNDDIKVLIQALENKKNNFSSANTPPIRKKTRRMLMKNQPNLYKNINAVINEKTHLGNIKKECDTLIKKLNNLL